MKILITGGTGFIGKQVVRLMEPHVETIYLLVRKDSMGKARNAFPNSAKIHFIEGDILANDVCSRVEDVKLLSEQADSVLHLAAKYDLTMNVLDAYTHNVIGVQNVLTLARKFEHLSFFHHVSTYAVNGASGGRVKETDFLIHTPFPDHYSKSKMQGEHLVRSMDLGKNVKKRIYRPGIVVGHSETGEIEKVDGPYYFLKFMLNFHNYHRWLEKLGALPLPYGPKTIFPVIAVDSLSEWIAQCALRPAGDEPIKCYHLMNERQISLKDFVERSLLELGIHCSVKRLKRADIYKLIFPKLGMPKELMPYMFMEASYDVSLRKKDFPKQKERAIEEIIPNLIQGSRDFFEKDKA